MADISSLATGTAAASALSVILVTPQKNIGYQPQNPSGQNPKQPLPSSILFDYEGEQTGTFRSDITDHYVEDNSAIQDHWALAPDEVATHGFIGELNDIPPAILQPLQTVSQKLGVLGPYTPVLSVSALIAYNAAFQAYQLAQNAKNAAVSAYNAIAGSSGSGSRQTRQATILQQFYGYRRSRTLFTVQTPWAIFEDMAIKDLIAVQDAVTQDVTDFNIVFKKMRFASTQTVSAVPSVQDRAQDQYAPTVNLGTVQSSISIPQSQGLGSYPSLGGQ